MIIKKKHTIDDLIIQSQKEWYYSEWYEVLLSHVLKLIEKCDWFYQFLINTKQDNLVHAYYIFGMIPKYFEHCFEHWNIDELNQVLTFLDELSVSKDSAVLDLLVAWCLEVLDTQKEILQYIISHMPENLKKTFMQYFSHYLEEE